MKTIVPINLEVLQSIFQDPNFCFPDLMEKMEIHCQQIKHYEGYVLLFFSRISFFVESVPSTLVSQPKTSDRNAMKLHSRKIIDSN